ncbi:hypothetical protein CEXT_184971 [Caerostris extrusa]|uniref:Uncharacterized protein n=1 Tax=Caerostris extrusa TaxID=172846 RepID=A0AAV4T818_CAEEX|nr:hypothetical protein CEXT_184971 [Caerostris extrusa]
MSHLCNCVSRLARGLWNAWITHKRHKDPPHFRFISSTLLRALITWTVGVEEDLRLSAPANRKRGSSSSANEPSMQLRFTQTGAWLVEGMNNPQATKAPTSLPLYLFDFIGCFNNLDSSLGHLIGKRILWLGSPLLPFLEASAI